MRIEVINPSQIPEDWYGELIGIDIETEDKRIDSPICLVSIWKYKSPVIYVIPIKVYRRGVLEIISDEELNILKDFISKSIVAGHNLQFDLSLIGYQWGVHPSDIYIDTFLVARILQLEMGEALGKARGKIGLKPLVLRIKPELSSKVRVFDEVVGTNPPFTYDIEDNRVIQYSGLDAYFPFVIIQGLHGMIKENERVIKLEMEMLKTSIDQRIHGLDIDIDLFNSKVEEFSNLTAEQNKELDKIVGWHVRCNAVSDKKKLLLEELGCEPTILTDKGSPSMSAEALTMMKENDTRDKVRDIISRIIEINTNFSTYNSVKKLPNFIVNGKLGFEVEQIGYDGTSRIYTKDYNVNSTSWTMREAIVPPKGKKFLYFDYKSAEQFIGMVWANCEKGVNWYNSGIDLHRQVMKEILGKDDITKEERAQAKVLAFSQNYGGGPDTIRKDLNCSEEYANKIYEDYQKLFPEIVDFRNETIQFAHEHGYTTTMLGRKRKLQNINSLYDSDRMKDERRSYNSRIQGSCADLLKVACTRCMKEFSNLGVRVAFTVFDSFLLEVPEDFTEDKCIMVMERMSDFTDIMPGLKLRYDWGVGLNWKEAKDAAE